MIEIVNTQTVKIDGVIHGSVTVATLANPLLATDIQAALDLYVPASSAELASSQAATVAVQATLDARIAAQIDLTTQARAAVNSVSASLVTLNNVLTFAETPAKDRAKAEAAAAVATAQAQLDALNATSA